MSVEQLLINILQYNKELYSVYFLCFYEIITGKELHKEEIQYMC